MKSISRGGGWESSQASIRVESGVSTSSEKARNDSLKIGAGVAIVDGETRGSWQQVALYSGAFSVVLPQQSWAGVLTCFIQVMALQGMARWKSRALMMVKTNNNLRSTIIFHYLKPEKWFWQCPMSTFVAVFFGSDSEIGHFFLKIPIINLGNRKRKIDMGFKISDVGSVADVNDLMLEKSPSPFGTYHIDESIRKFSISPLRGDAGIIGMEVAQTEIGTHFTAEYHLPQAPSSSRLNLWVKRQPTVLPSDSSGVGRDPMHTDHTPLAVTFYSLYLPGDSTLDYLAVARDGDQILFGMLFASTSEPESTP